MKPRLWIIMALAAVLALLCCSTAAADEPSGWCGTNLTWFISDNALIIRGTGSMNEYDDPSSGSSNIPSWYAYRNQFYRVEVREGVTSVGANAFAGLTLSAVELPGTLTRLADNAISDIMTRIYYRSSEYQFEELTATALSDYPLEVYCREGVVDMVHWSLMSNDGCLVLYANTFYNPDYDYPDFSNCNVWKGYANEITNIRFVGSFRSISANAFWNLGNLKYIEIESVDKLQTIKANAFGGTALTDVYFHGSEAQWNNITIESGNPAVRNAAIHFTEGSCSGGVKWTLNGSSLSIYGNGNMTNWSSFTDPPWSSYSSRVESIWIRSGVLSIGTNAFACCGGCKTIRIEAGVSVIGAWAFSGMTNLEHVYFDGTQEQWNSIDIRSHNEPLTDLMKPLQGSCGALAKWKVADHTLTITGSGAMTDYTETLAPWDGIQECFDKVVINGPTTVGAYAFYLMPDIKEAVLYNSVKIIRFNAFANCTGLTRVVGLGRAESVQNEAFMNCTMLEGEELSATAFVADDAFYNCTKFVKTVTFDLNGHGSPKPGNQYIPKGRRIVAPAAPTAQDWIFTGWYKNAECSFLSRFNPDSDTISFDTTLYAGWQADDLPISFEANGGSGTMATQRVFRNQNYILPENGFIPPEGKSFGGWLVNGTGALRQPGDSIAVTADVTLVAQWLDPYTITFNAGGGTGEMASVKVAPGRYFTLPNCSFTSPDGAVFAYWRRSDSGQAVWPGTSIPVNSDLTFTAQWKGPFVISFQANGGTGLMGTRYAGYGDSFIFPNCQFTAPAGKAFSHWHVTGKDTEYDITPANGASIYCSLTVTPVWRTAKVVFKANGGGGALYPSTMTPDSNGCIILPECSLMPPDGKVFNGWGDGLGKPGTSMEIHGDTTLNAMWTGSILTIIFDRNGATGDVHQHTIYNTHYYTLPTGEEWMAQNHITPPEGMSFGYWAVPQAISDNNHLYYYPGETIHIITNATVRAMWIPTPPATFTLTFVPDDGTGSMPVITVANGACYTMPECAFTPPEGKVFEHWTLLHDGYYQGTYYPGDEVQIYNDMTVVPYFRDIVYQYIVFRDPENNEILANQSVPEGELPTDPGYFSKPGFTQTGWTFRYIPDGGSDWVTIPYDFGLPLDYYMELSGEPAYVAVGVWAEYTENEYYLTLNVSDGGTAWLSTVKETYHYGDYLYVTWEADEDCYFEGATLLPASGDPVDVSYKPFSMPDCDAVVEVVFYHSQPQIESGTCGDGLYWTLDEDGTLTISGAGAMTNYNATNNITPFKGRSEIQSVVIQTGVTHIGSLSFWDCMELTSVSLPNGLQSIGTGAFQGCGMTEVEIPATVSSIDADAFCFCPLTSVTVPESMTVISRAAFRNLDSLTEVNIHDGVTSIGIDAFYNAQSLPSIDIPASVTSIGTGAFGKCYSLTSVEGMENVKTMGNYVFIHCQNLEEIWLPRLTVIPDRTFEDCRALTHIGIPSSVTRIGDSAFKDCAALEQIFYEGCQSMWDAIEIGENNEPLENAALFCKFKLSFETYGGPEIEPILFDWDEVPDRPEDPDRIGAYFTGWYLEETLDTLYDFDTPLNADTILYADYLWPDPSITLRLPNGLTSIESEAFAGAHVVFLVIPKTVTYIADDAFPLTTEYVLGYAGSAAKAWADDHGIAFIEIDDAWLASH